MIGAIICARLISLFERAQVKKIFLILALCVAGSVLGMEKSKQPASRSIHAMYQKEYEEWLRQWKLDHSAVHLAWYLSLSIYRDMEECVLRTRASRLVLAKQIDREIMPFDTSTEPFKNEVKDALCRLERQMKSINLKISNLEALKVEVAQEMAKKSKL